MPTSRPNALSSGREVPGRVVAITTVPVSLWCFFPGLFRYLTARGWDVHVVSSPGEHLDRVAKRDPVQAHALSMTRRISPLADFVALLRLLILLLRLRPQIVHAHTPKASLLGMTAAWLLRVPVRIYHLHGLRLATSTGWKLRLLSAVERLTCRMATQVLAVSPSLRDAAVELGICRASKIKVLGHGSINGVDALGRFSPANIAPGSRDRIRRQNGIEPGATVVGFLGRLVPDKGLCELVEAFERCAEKYPAAHLLLVGPHEAKTALPASLTRKVEDHPRISCVGETVDPPPYLAAMDLVVLPSYREGFGLSLLEAAALGLPTVASDIPGCRDAVADTLTGSLVPARDAVALEGAISTYLADQEMCRRHGAAGRQRAIQLFAPHKLWQALDVEYTQLVAAAGQPAVPAFNREAAQPGTPTPAVSPRRAA